jgi:hypothetical protein
LPVTYISTGTSGAGAKASVEGVGFAVVVVVSAVLSLPQPVKAPVINNVAIMREIAFVKILFLRVFNVFIPFV